MRILTCNIRYSGAPDGGNGWAHRKDICVDIIRSHAPDVICFQEMWEEQFHDLRPAFRGFETFGMADEPLGRHPVNSVFFRSDAFTLISAGGYWLSKTPHVPGSKSWDSDCVRLANWLRLLDKASGQEFRVINTHLDHISQLARERQAQLIVDDACAYPQDYAQLLAGDMNCDVENAAIGVFRTGGWQDTYGTIHGSEDPGHTFHDFEGSDHQPENGKIDWILAKGETRVLDSAIIRDARNGRFPSDHYFVSADVSLGVD